MDSAHDWQRILWTGVGGLLAVGVPDESRVVVGSHSGISVFDATTGTRTRRVRDDDYAWLDADRMTILLPAEGGGVEQIAAMGLDGGALPRSTPDGWTATSTPTGAVLTRGQQTVAVTDPEELRAYGFSPAGSVFVLGTAPNLTVLRRSS